MLIIDSFKKSIDFLKQIFKSNYFFILLGFSIVKISIAYFFIPNIGELSLFSLRYVFTGITILIPIEVIEALLIILLVSEYCSNGRIESEAISIASKAFKSFLYLFFLTLIADVITGIGFLLFIIPGIFLMMYFTFLSQIYVIDNIRSLKKIYIIGRKIAYKYWTQIILFSIVTSIPIVVLEKISSLQLFAVIYNQTIILLSMIIFSFMYLQIRKEFTQNLTN